MKYLEKCLKELREGKKEMFYSSTVNLEIVSNIISEKILLFFPEILVPISSLSAILAHYVAQKLQKHLLYLGTTILIISDCEMFKITGKKVGLIGDIIEDCQQIEEKVNKIRKCGGQPVVICTIYNLCQLKTQIPIISLNL